MQYNTKDFSFLSLCCQSDPDSTDNFLDRDIESHICLSLQVVVLIVIISDFIHPFYGGFK